MPSPVGHALGGLIVGLAFQQRADSRDIEPDLPLLRAWMKQRELLVPCIAAACLPDIDFAWGRHNMETHSVVFALVLGIVAFVWTRSSRMAIACAVAAGTHVLFDWLGSDDSPPLGVMALWPLSNQFYFAHAYVFVTISRRYWLPGFVEHNAMAVLREIAILLPVAAALWWSRARSRSSAKDRR